jgi:hypothetical protein
MTSTLSASAEMHLRIAFQVRPDLHKRQPYCRPHDGVHTGCHRVASRAFLRKPLLVRLHPIAPLGEITAQTRDIRFLFKSPLPIDFSLQQAVETMKDAYSFDLAHGSLSRIFSDASRSSNCFLKYAYGCSACAKLVWLNGLYRARPTRGGKKDRKDACYGRSGPQTWHE